MPNHYCIVCSILIKCECESFIDCPTPQDVSDEGLVYTCMECLDSLDLDEDEEDETLDIWA